MSSRHKKLIVVGIAVVSLSLVSFIMKPKQVTLEEQLRTIETLIPLRDSINMEVSKVAVAWHLDHMLLTINGIYSALDSSRVDNYKRRFNIGRTMMFTFNKIPRGRAQSPNQVRPPETIVTDSIYAHLNLAIESVKLLDSLPEKAHFTHPYIGTLNRKQTKKFLRIHTNHHLEIINDIIER